MPKRMFQDITNVASARFKHFRLTVHKHAHRKELLRWLFEVCLDFAYSSYTYVTAIHILDKYTARTYVGMDEYQLTGTAALLIAAKLEERTFKRLADYSVVTDNSCSVESIIQKEREILEMLDYELGLRLPHHYLESTNLKEGPNGPLDIFECCLAACLEDVEMGQTPFEVFRTAKRMAEDFRSGGEPSSPLKFYITHSGISKNI